ncbi:protein kinase, partial [Oryctes borbonicus]
SWMTDGVRKMEKYEQLAIVGEGSYGLVMKCRHRETDQIVAIKKFLETEEDATVRRMALREIRMLKKLRHENLVTMIEVFRYRKRFYLVFEYLEGTVLDELEKMPGGLGDERSRERIYQVTRAINFCHSNHIIHRDVKPENVLVSSLGVVKLCDFGFARLVSLNGEPCTEYVATRWYRAPELLVGEQQYGPPVDVWAIGCLFAEMMTGDPLFPGDSDIDQLYLIVRMIGKPCSRHQQIMAKSSQLRGMARSAANESNGLYRAFSNWSLLSLDFLVSCMKMDPQYRPSAEALLKHNYFTHDRFPQRFLPALREKVLLEFNANPLLRKYKADILLSSDRREEIRQRRSLQADPPKWKISLTESNSIKRKFSCDTVSSGCEVSDKSPLNVIKTTTTSMTNNVGTLRSGG